MTRTRLLARSSLVALGLALVRCSSSSPDGGDAATDGSSSDAPVADGDAGQPITDAQSLPFSCLATTNGAFAPNACPPPSGNAGEADFCFRPQFAGVTSVDAYVGSPTADFSAFTKASLSADSSGTWTGKATSLASGSYVYIFRVMANGDDGVLAKSGEWLLNQGATSFQPAPPNPPLKRSFPSLTIPQSTTLPPLQHVRGLVVFGGAPQPCYPVAVDVGEVLNGNSVVSEHSTANYLETGTDGTFDFGVAANGAVTIAIRYPFFLTGYDAGYPSGLTTPSVGIARVVTTVQGADVQLDPADVSYPTSAYAAMSPTGGAAQALPTPFTWTLVPGSVGAYMSVTRTNVAGNDPSYTTPLGTATTNTWDGTFNGDGGNKVMSGTTYWWGTWQHRQISDAGTMWVEESLLFPVSFQ